MLSPQEIAARVCNGTESYVTLIDPRTDAKYILGQITAFSCEGATNQEPINIIGSRRTYHIQGNYELNGNMELYKTDDQLVSMLIVEMNKEKVMPEFAVIVKNTDPTGERVSAMRINGIKFTNVPLISFTGSENRKETYNFVVDGKIDILEKML